GSPQPSRAGSRPGSASAAPRCSSRATGRAATPASGWGGARGGGGGRGAAPRLGGGASEGQGLERGHGPLAEREVVVSVAGRGEFVRRTRSRLRLPGRSLEFAPAAAVVP